MDIPLYISIPLIMAFVHYDDRPRAWRWAWAKVRRWWRKDRKVRHRRRVCSHVAAPLWLRAKRPESQIVLPSGKVMKIGVTNVQTSCAADDVLRGSAEFLIFDDEGRATMG